jgi:phage-related protein
MAVKNTSPPEGGARGTTAQPGRPRLLPKPMGWIGSSKNDISALPDPAKASFGHRLRQLQEGTSPLDTKPLPQFGTGVFELRERFERNAYRLMYVVNLKKAIYVCMPS